MRADDQEISVRAFLRSLPSLASWTLLACILAWALVVWLEPDPPPFWVILAAWPGFTIALGPLMWLRYDRDSSTPGWWRALALALLWSLCVVTPLLALLYGSVVTLLGS